MRKPFLHLGIMAHVEVRVLPDVQFIFRPQIQPGVEFVFLRAHSDNFGLRV